MSLLALVIGTTGCGSEAGLGASAPDSKPSGVDKGFEASALDATASDVGAGPATSLPDSATSSDVASGPVSDASGSTGNRFDAFVAPGSAHRREKLDLLFVIDNTVEMDDPQRNLARSIPPFLSALTSSSGDGGGFTDINVGVITTSLGSLGTSMCEGNIDALDGNDRGRLLPRSPEGSSKPLLWRHNGIGSSLEEVVAQTAELIQSAGEAGCGYEAPWEALYHFLFDPTPYAVAQSPKCEDASVGGGQTCKDVAVQGVDEQILQQRAAFLRPDSFLAIVVLSNENDASIKPAKTHWVPWAVGTGSLQLRASAQCADVPDDFEPEDPEDLVKLGCRSCLQFPDMPECSTPWPKNALGVDSDRRAVRPFHQAQRFGYSFLFSRDRYVEALSGGWVRDVASSERDGTGVRYQNPVFTGQRSADMVAVAAIVGVPRPLVEDAEGVPRPLDASAWKAIAGPIAARDKHMIESIAPRRWLPEFRGSGDLSADPPEEGGNGGERSTDGGSLQYACLGERFEWARSSRSLGTTCNRNLGFPLSDPRCAPVPGATSIDAAKLVYRYFSANPGLRHLRIVRDLGESGFAASICNKSYDAIMAGFAAKVRAMSSR